MTRSRAQDARSLPRVVVYWRDATTTIRFAVEVNVATVKDNPLLASDLLPIDGQFGEIKLCKMHATFALVRAFGPRWIDFEQNLESLSSSQFGYQMRVGGFICARNIESLPSLPLNSLNAIDGWSPSWVSSLTKQSRIGEAFAKE